MPKTDAMHRAIKRFGSEEKLGAAIGYSQRAIHYAKSTGNVSPLMAYRINAATKGRVSLVALCPLLDIKRQMRLARKRMNGGPRCLTG